jgi:membrane protein implicated in regulation of membrane protease activity
VDDWVIWLIAALVLAVGEMFTTSFFLAPFAGGALVAALLAAVGGGAIVSWAAFIVVSIVLLLGLRPIARRHLRRPAQLRTGTAALVGRPATVVERVGADAGCVRLGGEVWSARPYDEDQVFEPGARVHVLEIRGATALVSD